MLILGDINLIRGNIKLILGDINLKFLVKLNLIITYEFY